jgi:serine/threonine protein kinase
MAPPLAPGQAFGPRYRIRRLIGGGGTGSVYEAWDEERRAPVALKIISLGLAGSGRDLERELLVARQIASPHVVRILDIGEIGRCVLDACIPGGSPTS